MNCVGLETQQHFRDLIQLPKLVDDVQWVTPDEIEAVSELAVFCGLWLTDDPFTASRVLVSRSNKGYPSLIVPRYKAGDIGSVLKAPSEIKVESADFETLRWHNGGHYNVSGVTYLNTALHSGCCGSIDLGLVIFCYHPHIEAGPILLCTASVTGRPAGVKLQDQKDLFSKIVGEIAPQVILVVEEENFVEEPRAANLDEFLLKTGEQGALFLLVLVAAGGEESVMVEVAQKMRIQINNTDIQNQQQLMPKASIDEIKSILKQQGWSAYLRRIPAKQRSGEAL